MAKNSSMPINGLQLYYIGLVLVLGRYRYNKLSFMLTNMSNRKTVLIFANDSLIDTAPYTFI